MWYFPGQRSNPRLSMVESDDFDAVQLVADVMDRREYSVVRLGTVLEHPDSGFIITPAQVASYPRSRDVRSIVTIATSHPRLIPDGVFDFQQAHRKAVADACVRSSPSSK
jgi:hypothetical protein